MKKLITAALGLILMVGLSGSVIAGSLDSPGAPSAGSGMYTLQNLYDYLTSGAALTVQSSFQEPTSAPGSTMKSTKEIGDDIKAMFEECPVTAANVESGVKFFCTQAGSWGVQTGTLVVPPTPTLTPTSTPAPTITPTPTWGPTQCAAQGGYWAATQLASPDDYGCWFGQFESSDPHASCTTRCNSIDLTCVNTNWNTSSSTHQDISCHAGGSAVFACTHPEMTSYQAHSSCPLMQGDSYNNYIRSSGTNQDCNSTAPGGSLGNSRLCVCI